MKPALARWTSLAAATMLLASASSLASAQAPQPSTAPAEPPVTRPAAAGELRAASQPDPESAKRHLAAARDSLTELTQLPAAAQLSGDARAQVSQLITNFNELITTPSNWRPAHAKVAANLNVLLGDQRADESATPAAGTAGAIGTSGSVTIEPAIEAKLSEFRGHLRQFETASGGAAAPGSPEGAELAASTDPTGAPAAASRSESGLAATGGTASLKAEAGHAAALRQIAAIEALLDQRSGSAERSGSAQRSGAAAASLDAAQIDQIRTHLRELRAALGPGR